MVRAQGDRDQGMHTGHLSLDLRLSGKNKFYPVTADRGKELTSTLFRADVTGHFKGGMREGGGAGSSSGESER